MILFHGPHDTCLSTWVSTRIIRTQIVNEISETSFRVIEERHSMRSINPPHLSYVPPIPTTPTVSRIFAISLGVSDPLVAHKKSSKAKLISVSVLNSCLSTRRT